MFKLFIVLILFVSKISFAELKISPYRQNEWKEEWTSTLMTELSDDQKYASMLDLFIDEDDLLNLKCPDYNYASNEEKKEFWILFLASLARSESGLNENAKSPKVRGQRNYGLLQLALPTAKNQCDLIEKEDVLNGTLNLQCGLKLLNWQLHGAGGKRLDLKNQLFGKKILLWGPLRQNDKNGRKRLYEFFFKHLDQLPFCQLD